MGGKYVLIVLCHVVFLHIKQLMIKENKDLVKSNTISDFEDSYLSPDLPDSKAHVLFVFSKCFWYEI